MVSEDLITQYVDEHENAWSPRTAVSTFYSLRGAAKYLDGRPETLWNHLVQVQQAYTRCTTWARVVKFWDWKLEKELGHGKGKNNYREFRRVNARSFKNTYERKPAQLTFKETEHRLRNLPDPAIRKKALELLHTGMRYAESFTLENGRITGKGGKRRDVYNMPHVDGPKFQRSYQTFWRHLKRYAGITPHMLRKVVATHLARSKKLDAIDMCEVFGWTNMNTAMSYIAPTKKLELQDNIWDALHGQQAN